MNFKIIFYIGRLLIAGLGLSLLAVFVAIYRKYKIFFAPFIMLFAYIQSDNECIQMEYRYKAEQAALKQCSLDPVHFDLGEYQRFYELKQGYLDTVAPYEHLTPEYLFQPNRDSMLLVFDMNIDDMLLRSIPRKDKAILSRVEMTLEYSHALASHSDDRNVLNYFYTYYNEYNWYGALLEDCKKLDPEINTLRDLKSRHVSRLKERCEEGVDVIRERLLALNLTRDNKLENYHFYLHYDQGLPITVSLIIRQFCDPDLMRKVVSCSQVLEIYKLGDRKKLPAQIVEQIRASLSIKPDQPHLLGYAATWAEKEKVSKLIEDLRRKYLWFDELKWSFARERTGKVDEKGNPIYGYGLYVIGDKPNVHNTGLCFCPVDHFEPSLDFSEEIEIEDSAALQSPTMAIYLRKNLAAEWNYFTLTNKKKHFALTMDGEVLYAPYIEGMTDDTKVVCPENHRLRDCVYIYAILMNDVFKYPYFEDAWYATMAYTPIDDLDIRDKESRREVNGMVGIILAIMAVFELIGKLYGGEDEEE